jgi:hypothetical protein
VYKAFIVVDRTVRLKRKKVPEENEIFSILCKKNFLKNTDYKIYCFKTPLQLMHACSSVGVVTLRNFCQKYYSQAPPPQKSHISKHLLEIKKTHVIFLILTVMGVLSRCRYSGSLQK